MNQLDLTARTRLHGPTLAFVRVAWLLTATLIIGLLVVGTWLAFPLFQTPCLDAACLMQYARLTPLGVALLQTRGIPTEVYAGWSVGLDVVFVSTSFVIAAVIFWRKSNDPMALFVSFTLLLFGGVSFSHSSDLVASVWPAWRLPEIVLSVIGLTCFTTFLCVFPDGRFVPPWMRWVALVLVVVNALSQLGPYTPFHTSPFHTFHIIFFVIVATAQVYRYRRVSNATERQQTKWVVSGFVVGVGGYLSVGLIRESFPLIANDPFARMLSNTAAYGFMLLVPLSIGVAVLRARLYDIDFLIRRTLIYGALTGVLAVVYFVCLLVLQNLVLGMTAQTGSALILISSASTLAIAALSRPLRQRIQDVIDRRFYRHKYDATKVIAGFGASLRNELNLDRLTSKLLAVVQETMQPEHAFLSVVPGLAGGSGGSPGSSLETPSDMSSLNTALSDSASRPAAVISPDDPLATHFRTWPNTVLLSELKLESPVLHAMRAAKVKVATPLVSQGELVGVLNLGAHLSQQDYSRDDRELLDALAAQAAPAVQVAKLVREQRAQEEQRARIDQELHLARRIQLSLLPKEMPALPGWELDAFYQPARAVGGDFYDFIPLADGRIGIAIGDVTDKGMPAALWMASTRATLQATAQTTDSPGEVLTRVNALTYHDIPAGMFVTCLYAILDPTTGNLHYANAGHSLPYRWHDAVVAELHARGMPLGLMLDSAYEENTFTISCGEGILFHTDGVVEAHNQQREMFGSPRLEKLLGECPPDTKVNELVREQLTLFTGADWLQEDDITLVTLQRERAVR